MTNNSQFINLSKVQNDNARMQFLLKQMLKYQKELSTLGVDIHLEEVEYTTNDNLFKNVLLDEFGV